MLCGKASTMFCVHFHDDCKDQDITWTNVYLLLVRFNYIHLKEISHELMQPSCTKSYLENHLSKLSNVPWADDFKRISDVCPYTIQHNGSRYGTVTKATVTNAIYRCLSNLSASGFVDSFTVSLHSLNGRQLHACHSRVKGLWWSVTDGLGSENQWEFPSVTWIHKALQLTQNVLNL